MRCIDTLDELAACPLYLRSLPNPKTEFCLKAAAVHLTKRNCATRDCDVIGRAFPLRSLSTKTVISHSCRIHLVGPLVQLQKERKTQSLQLDDLKVHVLQIEFDAEEAVRLPTGIGEEPRAYIRDER